MKRARKTKQQRPSGAANAAPTILWVCIALLGTFVLLYFSSGSSSVKSLLVHEESNKVYHRSDILKTFGAMLLLPEDAPRNEWGVFWTGFNGEIAVRRRAVITMAAWAVIVPAVAAGLLVLHVLGVRRRLSLAERIAFAAPLGLSFVSWFTYWVGAVGLLQNSIIYLAAGFGCVFAYAAYAGRRGAEAASSGEPLPGADDESGGFSKWWFVPAGAIVALLFLGALLPPLDFDVREYHLQTSKEWYQAGRIEFLPHNVYGNMPMGAEVLCLPTMAILHDWFTGALAGKLLIALMAPLTAWGLFAAGRRFHSQKAGAAAALIFLATPDVLRISAQGLVEVFWGGYLFFAAYALACAHWVDVRGRANDPEKSRFQPPVFEASAWRLLAGWFAGSAAACKYPALMFVVAPGLVVATLTAEPVRRLRSAILFGSGAAIAAGPWYIKNAVLTGNPIYPLAADWLPSAGLTPELIARWQAAHAVGAFSPFALFYNFADALLLADWISPVALPLAIAALLFPQTRSKAKVLWAFLGFYLLAWWAFTHRIDRFLVPNMPLLAGAAGLAVAATNHPAWRWTTRLAVAGACGLSLILLATGIFTGVRTLAPLAQLRVDAERVNPWHIWLNEHTPEGKQVLLVGDAQPFDLKPSALYSTCFDLNVFELLARDRDPAEVHEVLVEQNVAVHLRPLGRDRPISQRRQLRLYRLRTTAGLPTTAKTRACLARRRPRRNKCAQTTARRWRDVYPVLPLEE